MPDIPEDLADLLAVSEAARITRPEDDAILTDDEDELDAGLSGLADLEAGVMADDGLHDGAVPGGGQDNIPLAEGAVFAAVAGGGLAGAGPAEAGPAEEGLAEDGDDDAASEEEDAGLEPIGQDEAPATADPAAAPAAADPRDLGFDVATVWALGVPLEHRAAIQAAMPDRTLHFITVQQPLAPRRAQLLASPRPCVASWGGAATPDLRPFLSESGIAFARIGPANLSLRDADDAEKLVPMGYYLEPAAGIDSASPLQDTARLLKSGALRQVPELLQQARALREDLLRHAVTGHSYGLAPALPRPDGRKTVVIIADDQTPLRRGSEKRFAAYAAALKTVRERFQGWRVWFVTNGEPELPTSVRAALAGNVDDILNHRYHPVMVDRADTVIVHEAEAGFDALIRKRKVICTGAPYYAGALLSGGDVALDEITAARFLAHARYVDPAEAAPLDAAGAVRLIARRAAGLAAPAGLPPVVAAPAAPAPVAAAAAQPVAKEEPAEAKPRVDPIKTLHAEQVVPPDWIAPVPALAAAEGAFVYLPQDLAGVAGPALALASGFAGQPLTLDRDATAQPAVSQARLAALAVAQPELYRRLIEGRLRRLAPRQALVVNLADPATRRYARICGRLGILRVHIPAQAYGMDRSFWPVTAPMLDQATSLFDIALVWDPSHRAVLEAAGFPAARIFDIRLPEGALPAPVPAERHSVLLWLTRSWSSKTDKESIDRFLRRTLRLADLLQMPMRAYLSADVVGKVLNYTLDQITLDPLLSYEVEGAELTPLPEMLAGSAIVLCDDHAGFIAAQNAGAVALRLAHDTDITSPLVATTCEAARQTLMKAADGMFTPAAPVPGGLPGAPALAEALAGLRAGQAPDGSALPAPMGTPLAMLLRGDPIGTVSSTLAEIDKDKTQKYLVELMGAQHWSRSTHALRALPDRSLFGSRDEVDIAIRWGIRPNTENEHTGAYFDRVGTETIYLEDGFLRSIAIGLSGEPTLSLVMDDLTPFYNATRPSRVETALNEGYRATDAQRARARAAMDRIAETKVTKYNFAPYRRIPVGRPGRKKILIVDQRGGDQSIASGLASPASFQRMITEAMSLSGDHDIIIKTHPDANIGGKASAIGTDTLNFLRANPAVTIVTEDMNGFSLIDQVDKVFVVTSGMGFEALIAGKEVWCFGVPFYGGWGLTTDRTTVPRRTARPTLEDVFHLFYIDLSRYYDPMTQERCEVEQMIDYIAEMRSWIMPPALPDTGPVPDGPPRLDALLPAGSTVWMVGFDAALAKRMPALLPGMRLEQVPAGTTIDRLDEAVLASPSPVFLIWNQATLLGLQRFVQRNGIPVHHMTPGFVQPPGFGTDPAVALVSYGLDSGVPQPAGPRHPGLEALLGSYDFAAHPGLIRDAQALRPRLLASGLSQYTAASPAYGGGTYGGHVLILGQADRPGAPGQADLIALARRENPGARLLYRTPPVTLGGAATDLPQAALAAAEAEIVPGQIPLAQALHGMGRVYVCDSLAGFEALMRGVKVTVTGRPFYAGWGLPGLTEAGAGPARPRKLTLDQVFAAAYLLHCRCIQPETGAAQSLSDLLDTLAPGHS